MGITHALITSTADHRKHYAIRARDRLLDKMARAGFVTVAQAEEAKREPLTVQDAPPISH